MADNGRTGDWEVVGPTRPRAPPRNPPQSSAVPHRRTLRKWQGGQRPPRPTLPLPRLIETLDNDAEGAWRSRQPPVAAIRIPDALVVVNKDDATFKQHEKIATQHGVFIFSPHRSGSGGSQEFGLWGEEAAVANAKRALLAWIEEYGYGGKSSRSAKFAKVASLTPKLRIRAENRWDREVRRQRYRQHPPPDMGFGAVGSFLWPVKEYRPEEILGRNHEALDPIRMECSCHVVFHPERNVFRVMGKPSEVQLGLERIRKTCFQITAKQISPVRLYLLRWRDVNIGAPYVFLDDYQPAAIISPQDATALAIRKAPACDYEENADDDAIEFARTQTQDASDRLRTSLLRTLSRLQYYRGHLQLRVRLGTFLVTQYKEPGIHGVYDLEGDGEYAETLSESQFSGETTQELGDKDVETALLPILQAAKDFLMPSEAMANDLKQVRPIYSATFTFADPAGHYRLNVEWHGAAGSAYATSGSEPVNFELTSKKWTRLDRDAKEPTALLEASLCDLPSSSAWQVDLMASPQVIDEAKLPQPLVMFSRNLRIQAGQAMKHNSKETFVRFNPFNSLIAFQQGIAYQYTIADSDYTLELAQFQDRTWATALKGGGARAEKVFERRWGVSMFRKAWDAVFAKNERLPIGERADWECDMETWFPIDIGPNAPDKDEEDVLQGWKQIMEKISKIEELVEKAKEIADRERAREGEDLIGGME